MLAGHLMVEHLLLAVLVSSGIAVCKQSLGLLGFGSLPEKIALGGVYYTN